MKFKHYFLVACVILVVCFLADWGNGEIKSELSEDRNSFRRSVWIPSEPSPRNWNLIVNLLALYDEYKIECYNDSTKVTFGYFYDWRTGEEFKSVYKANPGVIETNLRRLEDGYIHKKPSFEGFIEFLRRKMGTSKKSN